MKRRRSPEVISGRVAADGTILAGSEFSVNRVGAGSYLVTFPSDFRILSAVVVSSLYVAGNTLSQLVVQYPQPNAFQFFNFVNNGGGAGDLPFSFVATSLP